MRRPSRCVLVALALCVAVAAHAGPRITRFASPSKPAPASKRLPVFDLDSPPPRPVRVLAVISIESAGPSSLWSLPDHALWARLFQAPARAAGAQAVMGVHAFQKVFESTWLASALAVEYLDPDEAPDSCGCVVEVPEPVVHLGVSQHDHDEIARNLRLRLAALCAERGWYPLVSDSVSAARFGHGVDARLALALDSLRVPVDVTPERSRRVTSEPGPAWKGVVGCYASLVTAAGDTLLSALRPASTTDLFAILHQHPNGPLGPIDEAYWRAVHKELESLPAPSRAH